MKGLTAYRFADFRRTHNDSSLQDTKVYLCLDSSCCQSGSCSCADVCLHFLPLHLRILYSGITISCFFCWLILSNLIRSCARLHTVTNIFLKTEFLESQFAL